MHHLLPESSQAEEVAFVFTSLSQSRTALEMKYVEWDPVSPNGFAAHSGAYIELTDEARAGVIKRAHDLGAGLVEFHSHLYSREISFSSSDLQGLREFVPHVMWRLKGKPYAAVVVGRSGFDALVWQVASRPETLAELRVGRSVLKPTGLTLRRRDSR